MAKRLDDNGVLYLLSKLLLLFQRQEAGKGLSSNDLTNELKQAIMDQFSGNYSDLTGAPTDLSAFANGPGFQTSAEVAAAIASALALSGYQTAAQVEALIDAALANIDTALFIVVDALPDPAEANPNKIYIVAGSGAEWFAKDGAWEQVGEAGVSLEGYFNDENLVPITNAEIDAMIAGLVSA